jgi:hypothetical protein
MAEYHISAEAGAVTIPIDTEIVARPGKARALARATDASKLRQDVSAASRREG